MHVHYGLHALGCGCLDEVVDFVFRDNGFAGLPFSQYDLLSVLCYWVHMFGGDWFDWVDRSDINDTVNGCAGLIGQPIDGVQFLPPPRTADPITSLVIAHRPPAGRDGWTRCGTTAPATAGTTLPACSGSHSTTCR